MGQAAGGEEGKGALLRAWMCTVGATKMGKASCPDPFPHLKAGDVKKQQTRENKKELRCSNPRFVVLTARGGISVPRRAREGVEGWA